MPNFVGRGLQSAQDAAQAAGFYSLKSHDSHGRARMQILDRDWRVCSQSVKAGMVAATNTQLDFGVVKLDETCPAHEGDGVLDTLVEQSEEQTDGVVAALLAQARREGEDV